MIDKDLEDVKKAIDKINLLAGKNDDLFFIGVVGVALGYGLARTKSDSGSISSEQPANEHREDGK